METPMNEQLTSRVLLVVAISLAGGLLAPQVHAQNNKGGGGSTGSSAGVVTIDQARAEAGGVTSGDAPGFPVTITQPGSYRLMSNLTLANASVTAIEVQADDVTIDLNGFVISTPMTCSGGSNWACSMGSQASGIYSINHSATTVRNGHVRGFAYPVYLQDHALVEGVTVRHAWSSGIRVGNHGVVAGNTVAMARNGIETGGGIVRDNAVAGTGGAGVTSAYAPLVTGNRIASVAGFGVLSSGGAVHDNHFFQYGGAAFNANTVSLGDGMTNLCNGVKC
jgi:hypothetical protein